MVERRPALVRFRADKLDALDAALGLAREIADRSPHAIRAAKRLLTAARSCSPSLSSSNG